MSLKSVAAKIFAARVVRKQQQWMRDPLRIDPETKMIKFAQDGQKTGLTNIYAGDAPQQFDAVWHYLHTLNQRERPSKPATGE